MVTIQTVGAVLIMEFVFEIITGAIAAWIATKKNRNGLIWFLLGFFFSVLGVIVAAFIPARRFERAAYQEQASYHSHSSHTSHTSQSTRPRPEPQRQQDIPSGIELLVKIFAKLAKADGVVTKAEIHLIDQIIKSELQPDDLLLKKIRTLFNEAKYSPESASSIINSMYRLFHDDPVVLRGTISYLFEIAVVDEPIHPEQEKILDYAGATFKLSDYKQMKAEYVVDLDDYFKILGCSRTDSVESIKKQYRKLLKEYHPDKYMNHPKDFIELANQKVKEIKDAYDRVIKYKTTA